MIKRLISRFASWFMDKYSKPASTYQDAVARWATAQKATSRVYSNIQEIEVYFPSIETYVEELGRLLHYLEKDLHYKPPSGARMTRVQTLSFYLSSEQHLLNVPLYYEMFRQTAIKILIRYEELSNQPNKSGQLQSSLYNSALLVKNLIDLSEGLNTD